MSDRSRARAGLAYLAESWPLVVEAKTPGTPRRWTELYRERVREQGQRVDELVGGALDSPAPAVVSVLDLTHRLSVAAADLSSTVGLVIDPCPARETEPPHEHLPRPLSSAMVNPVEHWRFVADHLVEADELDPLTAPWVLGVIGGLVHDVRLCLGEVRQGQTLAALCPWCGGRTANHPTGGARTLQVIVPDPDDDDAVPLIVCTGAQCEPPKSAVGMWDRGRPAWPEREWDWLARTVHPLGAGE